MTAAQLAARHRRRAAAVEKEFRQTSNGLKIAAVKFTRELMTREIYGIPVDVTKAGKPKWRRTGNLRRSERAEVTSPYEVRIVNDAGYALFRHEAGKPGHRRVNPLRVSHWRDELVKTFQPLIADLYSKTVAAILETR